MRIPLNATGIIDRACEEVRKLVECFEVLRRLARSLSKVFYIDTSMTVMSVYS